MPSVAPAIAPLDLDARHAIAPNCNEDSFRRGSARVHSAH